MTDEPDDPRIVTAPLFKDELVAVVATAHTFATRRHVEPKDFAGLHLPLYSSVRRGGNNIRNIVERAGVEPARVSQVDRTSDDRFRLTLAAERALAGRQTLH